MITLLNKFDDKYVISEKDILGIALSYIELNGLQTMAKLSHRLPNFFDFIRVFFSKILNKRKIYDNFSFT